MRGGGVAQSVRHAVVKAELLANLFENLSIFHWI
jgi:hypothetical protein